MEAWQERLARFKTWFSWNEDLGFGLDVSRMGFDDDFLSSVLPQLDHALAAMRQLEAGSLANSDEQRMVGHYWLRRPELAPAAEISAAVAENIAAVKAFAAEVHSGERPSASGSTFKNVLHIGIGGSALGPQLVNRCLATARDRLKMFFLDNTDPDGLLEVLRAVPSLEETLCLVVSKSGGTKETRNAELLAKHFYQSAGLDFSKSFVAVTGSGSSLEQRAAAEGWQAVFPMWDWVGGRTSLWSAVGLLPAALQGIDIDELLRGAREMDELTRASQLADNPAAQLALMWLWAGRGRGEKDMVVLPYRDRLDLLGRYLQQLVMESLGKALDRDGAEVNQGLTVYGNKGSTDQHAYIQQLRDGSNNFFAVFVEVLCDAAGVRSLLSTGRADPFQFEVEPGVTAGDYLAGFYQGTRLALSDSGRESVTITLERLSTFSLGLLLALFERTVGLYGELINVNAYHQPGVEAGKRAAAEVLELQLQALAWLEGQKAPAAVSEVAAGIGMPAAEEVLFKILRRCAINGRVTRQAGTDVFADRYYVKEK